jgi:16S rRNA (guanine527-N7)-methyltransferase
LFEEKYNLPSGFDEKCEVFSDIILKYNQVHNITGAKDKRKIYENIEDSLHPISFLHVEDIKTAVDVGSGAGFPGLILAMAMPNTHFTLFEPITKKSSFLHLAKSSLNLKNVTISTSRVEKNNGFKADLICSRAVTNTKMLINLCKSYISPSSTLLFYKGQNVSEELEGLSEYKIYKKEMRNYLVLKEICVD